MRTAPTGLAGGVGGVFWAAYVPVDRIGNGAAAFALAQIGLIKRMTDASPELELARTAGVQGGLPVLDDGTYNYNMTIPLMLGHYFPAGMLGLGLTALMASFITSYLAATLEKTSPTRPVFSDASISS